MFKKNVSHSVIYCAFVKCQISVALYISHLLFAASKRTCNFPWHDFRQESDGSFYGSKWKFSEENLLNLHQDKGWVGNNRSTVAVSQIKGVEDLAARLNTS